MSEMDEIKLDYQKWTSKQLLDYLQRFKSLSPEDKDKLKRAIVAGSLLAGVYAFNKITADEWFEKDKDGNFQMRKRTILEEIFE
jgi:hypothetical protein